MRRDAHELILELTLPVETKDGRLYHATVVARAAGDGHWNAWLEFLADDSEEVLRTGIETHQAGEADLHHWAQTLGDVYLQGALERALVSPVETIAHRWVMRKVAETGPCGPATELDPFRFFDLGGHVLHRELLLLRRATLLALIINYDLNPRALDLSKFTKAQLATFVVTAVEVQRARGRRRHARHRPDTRAC